MLPGRFSVMKETAGNSSGPGQHGPQPTGPMPAGTVPDMAALEQLAVADTRKLQSADCLAGASDCAKAMAYFQARQTEYLARFGRLRTDRETGFDDDTPSTSAPSTDAPPPDDSATDDSATGDSAAASAKSDTAHAAKTTTAAANSNAAPADGSAETKAADAKAGDTKSDAKAADTEAGDTPPKESAVRDLLAGDLVRWAGDEVACELDVAGITGTTRLLDALMVVSYLPQCLKGLKSGRLSARRFRKVVEVARELSATLALQLDAEVAGWDERTTFGTFSRRVTRWRITNQPDQAEENHQRTARDRSVQFTFGFDGAACLTAFGPADRVQALYNMIDAAARSHDGTQETEWHEPDKRTLDQLRFDLLTAASVPTQGGNTLASSRYRVGVTVPVATLLGAELPGDIAGYGPIPAGMARKIAAGVQWIERILVDPITGRPIDADRKRYRLSTRMRQFIHARDPECTLPSCSKPAEACEIDHIEPWPEGSSDADNLHPACKSHHQGKTARRFHVEVRPHRRRRGLVGARDRWRTGPRLIRWTLPSGRYYDILDDNDPTAARLETAALENLAMRAGGRAAKLRHRHWRWRVEAEE